MRYPPTCTSLSMGLSSIATHPVGDVLLGTSVQRSSAAPASRPAAVILDLFGTLVVAPSVVERRAAAAQFAAILRVTPAVAESVLSDSWQARHDGQLSSTTEVAAHLVNHCNGSAACEEELEMLLARLAHVRLQADATLLRALEQLRHGDARLAILSDASPDIGEAWSRSNLAPYFDAVVFSCRAGAVKPAPSSSRRSSKKSVSPRVRPSTAAMAAVTSWPAQSGPGCVRCALSVGAGRTALCSAKPPGPAPRYPTWKLSPPC